MNYWDDLLGDDEHAASYMLTYGEGPGSITRMTLGEFINEGESVLDVGCGPGWNFDHFQLHGPDPSEYKGLDYSERFVRTANDRCHDLYGKRPFALGDVRDIKEPDESWDVVIMQDVLEHTNGYEKPIQEALRVAKKRVIAVFWHLTTDTENRTNDDGNDGYGSWYSQPRWEEYLDSLDYHWLHHQIIDDQQKPRDYYIIDKEEPHGDRLRQR